MGQHLVSVERAITRDALRPHDTPALCDHARRSGTRRVAIRVQGEYEGVYRRLVALGGRVRWSDLRMTLDGYAEPAPRAGSVVLSNWEI